MYTVVEFEGGIMAVPSAWINVKELTCKWPPYSNVEIERAIANKDEVAEDWNVLSIVRVFGRSVKNLETAKEKARLTQLVSDCDDEEVLKKTRHERKRKTIDSSNEDSDEDSPKGKKEKSKTKSSHKSKMPSTLIMSLNARQNVVDSKLLTASNGTYKQSRDCTKEKETPSKSKICILPQSSFSHCDIDAFDNVTDDSGDKNIKMSTSRRNISDVLKIFEKNVNVNKTDTSTILNNEVTEKLNYIISLEEENVKKCNAILQEIKKIRKEITNFRTNTYDDSTYTVQSVEESVKKTNLNDFFPLNDSNALEAMEEKLENRVLQKEMITLLAKRRGRNANEFTNNVLSKVFTNNFAAQYSYCGKQKKKALSELKITKCIIETVTHSCENVTECEVQKKIGNWLANAPTRISRERIKKDVKSQKKNEEKDNQGLTQLKDNEEELNDDMI